MTRLEPKVLVVMGVSGSGKSTVGARLAQHLGWPFADGDDFHSTAHIEKMRSGHALDDADRQPWLALLRQWIDARLDEGRGGVIVCSALKRSYRDALRGGRAVVRIVYLEGSRELIANRLAARRGHFMAASLLDTQFAALQQPTRDEGVLVVDIEPSADTLVARIVAALARGDI